MRCLGGLLAEYCTKRLEPNLSYTLGSCLMLIEKKLSLRAQLLGFLIDARMTIASLAIFPFPLLVPHKEAM